MAVPAGGEIAIYDAVEKSRDYRLVLGLTHPNLTALKSDSFTSALSASEYWYTEMAGAPDVSGGSLNFQLYGGPLREMVVTRPHWYHRTRTLASKTTFGVEFPEDDPVYPPMVVVGGLDNEFGQDGEPFRIFQKGSAQGNPPGGTDVGGIFYQYDDTATATPFANDKAIHTYVVEWDPDGVTNHLRITRDAVEIFAGGTAPFTRPVYVAMGAMWDPVDISSLSPAPDLGTPASPKVIMRIHDLQVEEFNSEGYDTQIWPGWTSANAGGTLDTAADGERFDLDGETFAKIPHENVISIKVRNGLAQNTPHDSMRVELGGPHPSDPETTPNRFQNDLVVGRNILLDTTVTGPTGTTAWKRQIAAVVNEAEWEGDRLVLDCVDIPSEKLDSAVACGYTNLSPVVSVQSGEIEGVREGLAANLILDDLVDVTDAIHGGVLGATDTLIRAIGTTPVSIGTGGQSLQSIFQEWVDRLAHESYREYTTSGVGRYGRIRVHGPTISGSSGYTFRGRGVANGNILPPGVSIRESRKRGPSRVFYRNDSPVVGEFLFNGQELDILGTFPSAFWPPDGESIEDSFALLSGFGLTSLLTLKDKDNVNMTGGVAKHRYIQESMWRRVVSWSVEMHDWVEPTDLVAINDSNRTGMTTSEVLVVVNRTLEISGQRMKTEIEALPLDWINSIMRTLRK